MGSNPLLIFKLCSLSRRNWSSHYQILKNRVRKARKNNRSSKHHCKKQQKRNRSKSMELLNNKTQIALVKLEM